ncbi:diguanylate cyclase [Pseudomonas oryzihabitans]|nr:diguanylate cyclase [Pseudomonas psychrotolerans]KTT03775.1 diguanylate cyclase [Pseudomonas psychrotolerans]KTT10235.1 diguanylate cyclase [Pseudomonas psychrotolerans]KTT26497.1 diguanylate cyclase [Pseudomonas psychrotolerans]KTT28602.1 diguanylate cyclase [Pseudomonas psychrotolerans]
MRYERHVKRIFRLPLLVLQPLILLIWPLSLLNNPLIDTPYQPRYLAVLVLLLAVTALLCLARSARMMNIAFTGNIWALAFAFRLEMNDSGELGLYWNLPIAILITLGTCGMTYRLKDYLITLSGAWFILFVGQEQLAPATMPRQLVWMLVVTTLAIGIAYNYVNSHWMRRTFSMKERYRILAETDALTGIANRRKLLVELEALIDSSSERPCHFVMLDVDDFKSINDRHGHQGGDEVLIALATAMRTLDPALSVGRLGGEEFGILAQGLSNARLDELLERLRTGLACHPLQPITFSAGAIRMQLGESLSDLLRRVDEALYLAKRQGKDRVVWSS